jgi:hypothetical protein
MAFEGSAMGSVNPCKCYTLIWFFSQKHISNPHERLFITNYHFYRTDRFPRRKDGTVFAVRKDNPPNHVDLPPLVSI